MILTVSEYAKKFPFKGKVLSDKTIARRCDDGLLPSNHIARQLPGKQGQWVIDIPDEPENKKTEPVKSTVRSLNNRHYSW